MESGLTANRAWTVVFATALAGLFCASFYLLFGNIGIGLGDQGYLWYGVQRTVAGEIPIRDFQAYEPGRYYWCSAFASLVGDGILGVRIAATAFQAVGLTFALLVASRFVRNRAELAFCALVLGLWMFPNHKLFEPAMAAIAVWFATRLIERPSRARHFAVGTYAGLAAFMGANHAVYAALSGGALVLLLALRERHGDWPRRAGAWALGGMVGFTPLLAMFLFVPGFASSFYYSHFPRFVYGSNKPIPYPWPWRTDWLAISGWEYVYQVALALAFLLPCIVLVLGLLRSASASSEALRKHAPIVAAALVGTFYVHHCAVRSDVYHLAECSPPLILLALGLPAARRRLLHYATWGGLALLTVLLVLARHPNLSCFRPDQRSRLLEHEVAGETVRMVPRMARGLRRLEALVERKVPHEETIFIAPNRPMLYPLLGKVCPTWWNYFLFPASAEEQSELIEELTERRVNWAILIDKPIDGREDLQFRNTHPLLWGHVTSEFDAIAPIPEPDSGTLYRRRELLLDPER